MLVASEGEIEEIRGDSPRKHREIVVLAHLHVRYAYALTLRREAHKRARARAHPHAHMHAGTHVELSWRREPCPAERGEIASAARGEKGALEKGRPRCEHRDGRLQLRCTVCTHPVA